MERRDPVIEAYLMDLNFIQMNRGLGFKCIVRRTPWGPKLQAWYHSAPVPSKFGRSVQSLTLIDFRNLIKQ
ncbi:hypothetical protein RRG08_021296 [Elysia crispata]|uniref:Uncharacterized protein n=1 Tax=Elysia crispata TaxID=231223 RepID=A0AAE1DCQ2_9GAST|nr:hypothetical protein RRG08_021296 [Elysia crispata]